MQEFRRRRTIEVVKKVVKGEQIKWRNPAEHDGYLVQNKGKDSERWVVPYDVFKTGYEEVPTITKPTTFVERLQVEYRELVNKKVKLQAFFATPNFLNLPREKKTLLYRQERVMSEYIEVLEHRIDLEGSKYKIQQEVPNGNDLKYYIHTFPEEKGKQSIQTGFIDKNGQEYINNLTFDSNEDSFNEVELKKVIKELVNLSKRTKIKLKEKGIILAEEVWRIYLDDPSLSLIIKNYIEECR